MLTLNRMTGLTSHMIGTLKLFQITSCLTSMITLSFFSIGVCTTPTSFLGISLSLYLNRALCPQLQNTNKDMITSILLKVFIAIYFNVIYSCAIDHIFLHNGTLTVY